jgi:hypothetical protein
MSRPKVTAWKTGLCKACYGPIEIGDKLKLYEEAWIHTECAPKPEHKQPERELPWLALPNPWRDPRLAALLGYEIPETEEA